MSRIYLQSTRLLSPYVIYLLSTVWIHHLVQRVACQSSFPENSYAILNQPRIFSPDEKSKLESLPRQSRRRQGFSIAPRGCEVAGESGTCMFVWECLKTDGKHLGMCMDGFMFGSCCIHSETNNVVNVDSNKSSINSSTESFISSTSAYVPKRPTRPSKPTKPPIVIKSTVTTTSTAITTPTTTLGHPTRPSRPPKPPLVFDDFSIIEAVASEKVDFVLNQIVSSTARSNVNSVTVTTTTTTTTASTTTTMSTTTTKGTTTSKIVPATNSNICGVPQTGRFCPSGRIVNGTKSCYGQFPWLVSVRRTSFFGFSSTHRCGGALLNENWVATAGHCVDDLLLAKIRVRMGELDFGSSSEPEGHIERKVVQKIVHQNYNFFTYENDLALLKLEQKVEFKENIIPICLPGNNDLLIANRILDQISIVRLHPYSSWLCNLKQRETGIVAGWGRLSNGGKLPTILQYVSVPIVSNSRCEEMFLKAGRHEIIPDIFMCAGYENGGRDSCQGDSGGPLVVKGKDGRYFLGGIISWGIGCAEPNLPGVCTRISKFREWILERVT